jgi:hypothetical protein
MSPMAQVLHRLRANRTGRQGGLNQARRATLPYTVDQPGLTVHDLGPEEYHRKRQEREEWCEENCRGDWDLEPIRAEGGPDTGRRYLFADPTDAVYFMMKFS